MPHPGGPWFLPLAVDVLAIPHAVEEHFGSLDVVADPVVTDAHAPLADHNAGKLFAARGVRFELLKGVEHAAVVSHEGRG